jgi:hypothetical protein
VTDSEYALIRAAGEAMDPVIDALIAKIQVATEALERIAEARCDTLPSGPTREARLALDALAEIRGEAPESDPVVGAHMNHYRSCGCLADSAECCVASCACHGGTGGEDTKCQVDVESSARPTGGEP